jgi:hypothetical protein
MSWSVVVYFNGSNSAIVFHFDGFFDHYSAFAWISNRFSSHPTSFIRIHNQLCSDITLFDSFCFDNHFTFFD